MVQQEAQHRVMLQSAAATAASVGALPPPAPALSSSRAVEKREDVLQYLQANFAAKVGRMAMHC